MRAVSFVGTALSSEPLHQLLQICRGNCAHLRHPRVRGQTRERIDRDFDHKMIQTVRGIGYVLAVA